MRRRGHQEAREIGKQSVIIIVTVWYSGHPASHSAYIGPGRLVGDVLPLLPSIHLHPIHLTPT